MAKLRKLSESAEKVLEIIQTSDKPLSFGDIKAIYPSLNPSHLTALANRGLVDKSMAEVEVIEVKEVVVYTATGKDPENE